MTIAKTTDNTTVKPLIGQVPETIPTRAITKSQVGILVPPVLCSGEEEFEEVSVEEILYSMKSSNKSLLFFMLPLPILAKIQFRPVNHQRSFLYHPRRNRKFPQPYSSRCRGESYRPRSCRGTHLLCFHRYRDE